MGSAESSLGQEEDEAEVGRQVGFVATAAAAAESHWLLHTMNIPQCNL